MSNSQWEIVHDVAMERVRRIAVPGGWLYQTECDFWFEKMVDGEAPTRAFGWSSPAVFVPVFKP